jgi:hypothetical protein
MSPTPNHPEKTESTYSIYLNIRLHELSAWLLSFSKGKNETKNLIYRKADTRSAFQMYHRKSAVNLKEC